MAGRLTGKVAVITGAGSEVGIGKETAKAMAAEGAKVVVNDIGKDKDGTMGADRVVAEIKKVGGTAVANYDSVTSMQAGENIVKTAIDSFGRVDILVNTAGNYISHPMAEFPEKDWDAIIAVHLKGMFACTKSAVKEMIKQKSGGRVIDITSIGGYPALGGNEFSCAYSAAKAGVLGFTKAVANDMLEHGITVNAISPGAVTKLFPNSPPSREPTGPDYITPMIVYLCSDEAKEITGQIIFVSGGDIIIHMPPMGTPGAHQYYCKEGMWTPDELSQILPGMVAASG
jgi:NAD(P)-dependent dehydrogenase (short-subunit alcohol dehydrogenase family)